jgi:hypothetical protein
MWCGAVLKACRCPEALQPCVRVVPGVSRPRYRPRERAETATGLFD